MQVKMLVVSTVPRGRLELAQGGPDPVVSGDGPIDFVCGQCGRLLAAQVTIDTVEDLVLQCGDCGSLNIAEA